MTSPATNGVPNLPVFLQEAAVAAPTPPSLPVRPKRPLTPYNIFFQHERRKLLASKESSSPAIGFAGLARTVAAKWKATPPEERQTYIDLSVADRARYDDQMAVWKHRMREHTKLEKAQKKRTKREEALKKKKAAKSLQASQDPPTPEVTSEHEDRKPAAVVVVSPPATQPQVISTNVPFVPLLPSNNAATTVPLLAPVTTPKPQPAASAAVASSALVTLLKNAEASILQSAAAASTGGITTLPNNNNMTVAPPIPSSVPQPPLKTHDLSAFLGDCLDIIANEADIAMPDTQTPTRRVSEYSLDVAEASPQAEDPQPAVANEEEIKKNLSSPALLDMLASHLGEECLSDFVDLFRDEEPEQASV